MFISSFCTADANIVFDMPVHPEVFYPISSFSADFLRNHWPDIFWVIIRIIPLKRIFRLAYWNANAFLFETHYFYYLTAFDTLLISLIPFQKIWCHKIYEVKNAYFELLFARRIFFGKYGKKCLLTLKILKTNTIILNPIDDNLFSK